VTETGRPVTTARLGLVSCPHAFASAAGAEILQAGGSAVDAAIAASAALSVLYPHMTSVGGDAFWLIYDASKNAVRYLGGGGRAAAAATIETLRARGLSEIPYRGALPGTLTVPGGVASWCDAHAAYGRLPLARSLQAAIGYARDGFPVTGRVAQQIKSAAAENVFNAEARAIFTPFGVPPAAGTKLANPDLARTLERIAASGRDGFYGGETARELARFARDTGGFFDEADLRAQDAAWGAAVSTTYRGVTLYETPAPTQGFTVLEMLNLVEPLDVGRWEFLGPDHVHFLVQAKQLAYHDRDRHLADPEFASVPIDTLISRAYADERRKLMDPARALAWDRVPSYGSLNGDTVFVAVVDAQGNAAALVQSLYGFFGSGVVAGGTGVVLQNRSAYFTLDPAHPNRLEPRKRPLHTLIASFGFRDDRLWQVFGCMGADGQPQIHLQAYVATIDFGLDI
jgi:gamma-glutamyltranspeptidase